MQKKKPHVLIIGGGFGGLNSAIDLGKHGYRVTLIDKQNFHLFQPLLYQVATGFLSPADIASPLRAALAKYRSVNVIQDTVTDLDVVKKTVMVSDNSFTYDILILATGARNSYFGNDAWQESTTSLKTVEDSLRLRAKIFSAFEAAERVNESSERSKYLTFIIVGGGPTGVELAGAIAELSRVTLKNEFRKFESSSAKVMLFEAGERLLSSFHPRLSKYATNQLRRMGVEVYTKTLITDIGQGFIKGNQGDLKISLQSETIIWAAGVKASELSHALQKSANVELDRMGRVKVEKNLSIKGYPDVFVIGDLASFEDSKGRVLPGLAPVAIQEGAYVARQIRDRFEEKEISDFKYFDKGNMAVMGKSKAVAEKGFLRLTGSIAWFVWAFIHIYFLIEFENKFIVFFRWAWNYFTNKRGSRLITKV